jgi:hypothetical protein
MLLLCHRPWQSPKAMFPWYRCQQTQSSSNRVAWEVVNVSAKRAEWNFVCGYCAESERSPDFIVRFDNATCGLAGSVNRHSYLYWPPDFTQFMYHGCQCGAVCLQSNGKAISPCSMCPGCCLLISPAGQHFFPSLEEECLCIRMVCWSTHHQTDARHVLTVHCTRWSIRRIATPITYLSILLRLLMQHSKWQHMPKTLQNWDTTLTECHQSTTNSTSMLTVHPVNSPLTPLVGISNIWHMKEG